MFRRKAWAIINHMEKKSRRHVGLWHETYVVPPVRAKKTAATTLGRPAGDGEGERRARGQPLRRRASVSRAAESMTAWACIRPG